jgi:hypothetical protein
MISNIPKKKKKKKKNQPIKPPTLGQAEKSRRFNKGYRSKKDIV